VGKLPKQTNYVFLGRVLSRSKLKETILVDSESDWIVQSISWTNCSDCLCKRFTK